jgi:predicted ribosome quality control (RQC) complex YloA/Tae2 family protein
MNLDFSRLRPSFDALCATALRQELEAGVLGGAVQRVEVRANELSLEIYAHHLRRRLFCHIGDDATRMHLTAQKSEPSAVVDSPMLLQLRKHVRGGRVVQITQPRLERLLRFEVTTKDDGEIRTCGLIIETMGRRSNAILVDENEVILEALRRTPPSRSPQRPVLPRLPYVPPPPQDRLDPSDSDLAEKLELAANDLAGALSVSEALSRLVAGFSPNAAREVAYRADVHELTIGDIGSWDAIATTVRAFVESIESGIVEPNVAYFEDAPISLTPYRPHFLESTPDVRVQIHESMSAAIEAAFSVGPARQRVPRSAAELSRRIREVIEVERRREGALSREIPDEDEIERLRLFGEAIFASLSSIPTGATSLEFNGLTVPLDPPRSPIEVANGYFSDYRKRRDAAAHVPELQEHSAHRIEYLESLLAMAEASDAQSTHRQISRELDTFHGAAQEPPKKRRVSQEPQPRRYQTPDGFTILVGTNGTMNERVTFKVAGPDDIWFHARGEPGAHVILRGGTHTPSAAAIKMAADLAAKYSRGRAAGAVPVDHTPVRNVRKIRGAPPGLVRYVNEQTVIGHPDDVA